MKKETLNTNETILSAPKKVLKGNDVTFTIYVYQDGEVITQNKDGKITTNVFKREYNELTFEFTFISGLTLSQQIGRFIDTLLASQKLKFNLSKKIYSRKLNLIFEINFEGVNFSGKDIININPYFQSSKTQIRNFYFGLCEFIGTISGLYKQFEFAQLDTFAVLNGKLKDIETPNEYKKKQLLAIAKNPVSHNKITENLNKIETLN